jgi:hypothetical protein
VLLDVDVHCVFDVQANALCAMCFCAVSAQGDFVSSLQEHSPLHLLALLQVQVLCDTAGQVGSLLNPTISLNKDLSVDKSSK